MSIWQWVITICLPILTIEHCGLTIYHYLKRNNDEEFQRMDKRDKEWQLIFKSIDHSFIINAKRLLDTWAAMKIFHDKVWKEQVEPDVNNEHKP